MTRVLISYRREDTGGWAGRLYDQLAERFESANVFLDLDTIEPGVDFVRRIQAAVEASDVVLVLIGPRWLSVVDDEGQPRLQQEGDWVRREILTALERGVWTIPVLIDGASLPAADTLPPDLQPLLRRNAFPIGQRFREDVELLMQAIERGVVPRAPSAEPRPRPTGEREGAEPRGVPRVFSLLLLGAFLIALAVGAWVLLPRVLTGGAGSISLDPTQGPYDQEITVTGSGWPANEELEVTAEGLARTRVTTSGEGTFRTSIHLDPAFKEVAPNSIEISVSRVEDPFSSKSALYTVQDSAGNVPTLTPGRGSTSVPAGVSISLDPSQGPYEQTISVSGSGWPGKDELEITAEGLARTRVTTSADGTFRSIRLDQAFKEVAPDSIEVRVRRVEDPFTSDSALYTIRR